MSINNTTQDEQHNTNYITQDEQHSTNYTTQDEQPNINFEPTLSSSATLVELSIGFWSAFKRDKRVTDEVVTSKHAKRGAANVNKRLLVTDKHKAIKTLVGSARSKHRNVTLPWSNTGLRLISMQDYFKYHEEMTGMQQEFYKLVDQFLDSYDLEVARAQLQLGDMFDPADYPPAHSLRRKFYFTINYIPVPEAGDFRVDIPSDAKAVLQEEYQKFYDKQLTAAMRDLWERLLDPLENMVARLNYDDQDKPSGFRDTLVSNVEEIAKLLKTCNLKNDRQMEEVRQELVRSLKGVTPGALRESGTLRARVRQDVAKVADRVKNTLDDWG